MLVRPLHRLLVVAAAMCASCTTPSRDPGAAAAQATPATPRLANGWPDLNGTWGHATVYGLEFVRGEKLADGSVCVFGCTPEQDNREPWTVPGFPKYKREFLAKVAELSDRQVQADTVLQCRAPGVPRIGPPGKIVQTARELVFLYDDYSGSFFRIIPTDGRSHRQGVPASYLGDAIGRFENDTLVVETINLSDDTWLTDNGAFHTKDLKVVERLRRVGDTIEYQAIAHDPAVLGEPWMQQPRQLRLSAQELEESPPCDDRDLEHMVDGSHHENPR